MLQNKILFTTKPAKTTKIFRYQFFLFLQFDPAAFGNDSCLVRLISYHGAHGEHGEHGENINYNYFKLFIQVFQFNVFVNKLLYPSG